MPTEKVRAPSLIEVQRLFTEALKRTSVNPSIAGYRPQDHQIPFHRSEAQGRLFLGGNRAGKTVAGATECIYWLKGEHPYKKVPQAPCRGRGVSVDENDGLKKIMLPEIARWIPPSLLINGSWEDSYEKGSRILNLENKSFMEFLTYEQDVQKHAGTSRHFVWFDEEPPEDIYNENMLRLLDTAGSWWLTMTPLIDMSWTYDRLFEKALAGGEITLDDGSKLKILDMFQATVYDNEYVNKQQIAVATEGLGEEEKLARIQGKYFSYVGAIYSASCGPDNYIDPIHTSENWPVFYNKWGHFGMLDHGYTNPTAFYLGCFNEYGQVIIYYEYYFSNRLVKENAEAILQIIKDLRLTNKLEYIVADPSIWNTDAISGGSIAQEYSEHGLNLGKANNDVSGGILRMAGRFKGRVKSDHNGIESPLLRITNNCEKAKWEIQRYRWAKYDTSKAINKNNLKEVPHKKDDHAMDAIRYGIASRPQLENESPLKTGNVLNMPVALVNGQWDDLETHFEYSTQEKEVFDDFLGNRLVTPPVGVFVTLPILLTDVPHLPPFICLRCGAQEGTREYWVDTGIDVEVMSHLDGRLYICRDCLTDMVNASPDFYTKREMDDLVDSYNDVIAQASKRNSKWLDQVAAFAEIGIDLEKVWENLNGAAASTDHSEPVSSTGTVEPIAEQSIGSLLTIDL